MCAKGPDRIGIDPWLKRKVSCSANSLISAVLHSVTSVPACKVFIIENTRKQKLRANYTEGAFAWQGPLALRADAPGPDGALGALRVRLPLEPTPSSLATSVRRSPSGCARRSIAAVHPCSAGVPICKQPSRFPHRPGAVRYP